MITKEEIIQVLNELPDGAKIAGFVIIATKTTDIATSAHHVNAEGCHGICVHREAYKIRTGKRIN
jgi:hypothetical protein